MFTGIIEEIGTVVSAESWGAAHRITVKAGRTLDDLKVDDSIALDGCCQTVVARAEDTFTVVAVEETLSKTTLGDFAQGRPVNVERALRVGDRLGGHFVLGHIDCVGTVGACETRESSWIYWMEYPAEFSPLVIPVGSIAVNGVSLTVAQVRQGACMVSIIPHTHQMTTFGSLLSGDHVNLEFDMVGKYILGHSATRSQ